MEYLLIIMVFCILLNSSDGYSALRFKSENKMATFPDYFRDFPFRNTSLPWDERVNDLVSRLTLHEMTLQMARGGANELGGPAPAIPRLGIQAFQWDSECLSGAVQEPENATGFPMPIGWGAAFDKSLAYRLGEAISVEVRGKHNDFNRRGTYASHTGDNCYSPVVNIMRDPRWGRNQETLGEDPYLTAELANQYVEGLQGSDERYIRATSTCKHFDVHGGPENIPESRFSFNAVVSERDIHMTFLPAFRGCTKKAFGVMCSYNRINGVPACANKKFLTDILRVKWGFKGFVTSDEAAVENVMNAHKYTNNSVDTAAACVNAGCNIDLTQNLPQPAFLSIEEAVQRGKLTENVVRDSVKPLFYTRMRLGEFDPASSNPYTKLSNADVETSQHRKLATEAAIKSFVLLKNEAQFLPVNASKYQKVGIIGPMSNDSRQIFGDYNAVQSRSFIKTPYEGIRDLFTAVTMETACKDGVQCNDYDSKAVQNVVGSSDLIFLALGTGPAVEAEGNDRPDIELAGHQKDLLEDAISFAVSKPIVLLIFSASPVNLKVADSSTRVKAIMECFLPGQETGNALSKVLVQGPNMVSPGGRLPFTWYSDESQVPSMTNYSMSGRTYRYFQGDPLYPFGYGLSYSKFDYSVMTSPTQITAGEDMNVSLVIENMGNTDADEVVQCYISWVDTSLPFPRIQLGDFDRVFIEKEKSLEIELQIPWQKMAYWDEDKWIVPEGELTLYCGGQQPNQKRKVPSNILQASVKVVKTFMSDSL